jgi:hypothetical protein
MDKPQEVVPNLKTQERYMGRGGKVQSRLINNTLKHFKRANFQQ